MPVSGEAVTRLSTWALRWLLLALFWLALADSRALPELIAAAVVAALGATFAGVIVRPGRPHTFRALLRLLGLGPKTLLRPVLRLFLDTGLLTAALWRRLVRRQRVAGLFRAARHEPAAAARTAAGRTVTEIWGSVTPNRYVIGIDERQDLILVHELIRTDQPLDPLTRR
jgi:Na+/H+ ion antiporter subunit